MKQFLTFTIIIFILGISQATKGQNPSVSIIEGSKTYGSGINIDSCRISILTIGYRLGMDDGKPTVYSNIKWKGSKEGSNCLADQKFDIFLTVGSDTAARYIYAGGTNDLVAGSGNYEWGEHPISGTVAWDKLITKNFGKSNTIHFVTAEEAQSIWNTGFVVKTVKLVTEKGRVFILK